MKNLKTLYMLLALMLLILGIWVASSRGRQSKLASNSKTLAASPSTEQPSPQNASSSSGPQARTVMDEGQIRGWKTYRYPSGATFRYPRNLVLSRRGNLVKLRHSIRFKHDDPCDYSSYSKPISRLVDFDVSFELTSKGEDIPDIDSLPSNLAIKVGSLKGIFEEFTSEGCGWYKYTFPLANGQFLFVQREIIGMFSFGSQKFGDEEIALRKPGVIGPEQEELLVNTILSTFKLAEVIGVNESKGPRSHTN
jgi:hypothetical protein